MKNHHTWCIPIFSVQIRKKATWHEMPSLYKYIGSAGNGQFGLDTFVQTLFKIYDPHDKGIKIQKIKNLLAPSKNPNTCDISLVWPYMYICVCCQLFALVLYDHILVDQSLESVYPTYCIKLLIIYLTWHVISRSPIELITIGPDHITFGSAM